ncbi:hypothetical protein [Pseudomonas sp. MAG002Y]|uniref:hypothetical protein n=1 Tax=Pseudomonas sp. MAG002Y TaxID=2678690 RepID=UPI001C608B48|nr:hypothetical protein [Pseudomonas sp. MAG002Y]MBW5415854.1 hypothetical protein [Pseudomonas sp. MAG002Y]
MSTRPAVIVEKVLNSRGDISHCRIQISRKNAEDGRQTSSKPSRSSCVGKR